MKDDRMSSKNHRNARMEVSMKWQAVLAILVAGTGLSVAAGDTKEEAIMKDMAAMKGTWAVDWAIRDGMKLGEEQIKNVRFTIEEAGTSLVKNGDKYSSRARSKSTRPKDPRRKMPRKLPRERTKARPP